MNTDVIFLQQTTTGEFSEYLKSFCMNSENSKGWLISYPNNEFFGYKILDQIWNVEELTFNFGELKRIAERDKMTRVRYRGEHSREPSEGTVIIAPFKEYMQNLRLQINSVGANFKR